MWVFYHNVVETGDISLGMALGIPLFLTGIGLYVDSYFRKEGD